MPETVQLFRLLLAAPSDVTEEHQLVAGVINEWNVQHGDSVGARVELMNWRTHAHPDTGRRPQALINRQFADCAAPGKEAELIPNQGAPDARRDRAHQVVAKV